jgi:formimidoylglutamate deiminase
MHTLRGIANLHSHAFQRAMAGLAEQRGPGEDSFWTWRELMYRFAGRIDPDTQYAIAAQLYAEMLEAGYTAVCEFHYLHQAPDGKPYADPAAMSQAIVAAARDTGIRLTLLPVLYLTGGFDGRALSERQRRFGMDVQSYLALVERLRREEDPCLRVGIALHSLRAVPPAALAEVRAFARKELPKRPIHIHIAEQTGEVDDCLAVRGARPVEWLLDNAEVGADWVLVHATHLTEREVRGIAGSGATVAICPTTEANLGDGLFPLPEFLADGGRIGIGSDSNTSVSPAEELRWLEYGQRLRLRRRNLAADAAQPRVGRYLLDAVARSAASATGFGESELAQDRIALDPDAPALYGATEDDLAERFLFAGNRPLVREVEVAGRAVVEAGRHLERERFAMGYRAALGRLLS